MRRFLRPIFAPAALAVLIGLATLAGPAGLFERLSLTLDPAAAMAEVFEQAPDKLFVLIETYDAGPAAALAHPADTGFDRRGVASHRKPWDVDMRVASDNPGYHLRL